MKKISHEKFGISISIKHGFLAILFVQALIIGVCSFTAVRIFYHNYTKTLYDQVSTMLNLYVVSCENKLSDIERVSFQILSYRPMQTEMKVANSDLMDNYEPYIARKNIEDLLTGFLFSMDNTESIRFISNDGSQMISSYNYLDDALSESEIEHFRRCSGPRNGGTVWTYRMKDERLYMSRTIKEIQSNSFHDLGILILTCPMDEIFMGEINNSYQPIISITSEESDVYSSIGGLDISPEANQNTSDSGYTVLGQERCYYIRRTSQKTDWTYTYYIPDRDVLQGVNQLNVRIITALAIVFVFSLVLSLRFSLSITMRIKRLSDKIDDVRAGKYHFHDKGTKELYAIGEVEALNRNFYQMAGEIDHLINDVLHGQLMIKDMQYRILQGQINPHFMYNTLETINALADEGDYRGIILVTHSLSGMLRTSLSGQDVHSLQQEQELLSNYIAIQKIRFEERLVFTMDIPSELSPVQIPKLTLQPIVENSISYGLERFSRPCKIHMIAKRSGDDVILTIIDNGSGMRQEFIDGIFSGEIKPNGMGLGVKNIHERIRLAFGEKYGVWFKSKPGKGTIAYIRIPVQITDRRNDLWDIP